MKEFDPYHRWLGIPPKDQPPNHYRLLAIEVFEKDLDVIRDAAERQMGHVRRYGMGKHVELSQKLLNELGAAKACLLHPIQKITYDAALRVELSGQTARSVLTPLGGTPAQAVVPAVLPVAEKLHADAGQGFLPFPAGSSAAAPVAVHPVPPAPPLLAARGTPHEKRPRNLRVIVGGVSLLGLVCLLLLSSSFSSKTTTATIPLKILPLSDQAVQVGKIWRARARIDNAEHWKDRIEYRFFETEPEGASIDPNSGELRWTPLTPGVFAISICAVTLDSPAQSAECTFNLTVRPDPPRLIALADKNVSEGQELRLAVAVSNTAQAGSPLLFRLGPDAPRGAQIDPYSGIFTWTPGSDPGPGRYPISIEVVNPADLCDQVRFRVNVRAVNHAPQVLGPDTVRVAPGKQEQIQVQARDPDGSNDRLTYKLLAAPPWVSIEADSGKLHCLAPKDEVGKSHTFRIRVFDDGEKPLTAERDITVLVESDAGQRASPDGDAKREQTVSLEGKVIDLAKWNLLEQARERAQQLHGRWLARNANVYARLLNGDGSPLVDLCNYQRFSEFKLHGDAIALRDGINGQDSDVDWSKIALKRYVKMSGGVWNGQICAWDFRGRQVYYGEYDKGKRQGYCCFFRDGVPCVILDCSTGKVRTVYVIVDYQMQKHFHNEQAARQDLKVAMLVDMLNSMERELREYDSMLNEIAQREFSEKQNRKTRAAQGGGAASR